MCVCGVCVFMCVCACVRVRACVCVCVFVCVHVLLSCVLLSFIEIVSWQKSNIKNTLSDFDICHRMAPLRMLYSVTLIFIFKVIEFEMSIIRKRRKLAQRIRNDIKYQAFKLNFSVPKCKRSLSCPRRSSSTYMAPTVELLFLLIHDEFSLVWTPDELRYRRVCAASVSNKLDVLLHDA